MTEMKQPMTTRNTNKELNFEFEDRHTNSRLNINTETNNKVMNNISNNSKDSNSPDEKNFTFRNDILSNHNGTGIPSLMVR